MDSALTRLARLAPGRWLRVHAEVRQDPFDYRPLEDRRDDLQFRGAAVRAGMHVDVEDALGQPRPADLAGATSGRSLPRTWRP